MTSALLLEKQLKPCQLAARAIKRISVDAFLNRFVDSSYAYRFGALSFVACVAKLTDLTGKVISQKVHVDAALTQVITYDVTLKATIQLQKLDEYQLNLSSTRPIYFAQVEIDNACLSDNYVHIMPGYDVQIAVKSNQVPHGRIRAFNTMNSTAIVKTTIEK